MNLVVKGKCIGDAPTGHWGGSCMAWLGYVSCARGRYEGNVSNGQKGRGRHELSIVLPWLWREVNRPSKFSSAAFL